MGMKLLLNALKLTGENFPKPFVISDLLQEDWPLVFVNKEFEKQTLYSAEEVVGRNCRFLQGPNTDKETVKLIKNSINSNRPCYFNLVNYKKNGEKFWNRLLMIPIGIHEESIRYYIGVQTDVTSQYKEFDQKVPFQYLEKTDFKLKEKITEVVNYYRSYRYFDMLSGDNSKMDVSSDQEHRLIELSETAKSKVSEICEYLDTL
jgi:PAS domain S-box-containing protein